MRPHRPRWLRRAGATATGQFLDLSSNNAPPNLDALWQSGMRVLALKATESTTYAWAAGLALADAWHTRGGVVWWYHFARPGDPAAQARFFLGHIGGHLRPVDRLILDAEVAGVDGAFADTFWTQVVALDPVNRREDYGSPYFLRDGGFRPHHGEGLWLADYAAAVEFIPPGWTRLDAWQFTEHGSAPGYTGDVDRSYLYDIVEDDVPYSQWPAADKQAMLNDIEGRLAAPGGKLVDQALIRLAQWIAGRSNTWFNVTTVGASPPGGAAAARGLVAPVRVPAKVVRWSKAHLQQQVIRFLRIFAVTYVPLAIGLGRLDGKALLGLIAPTLLVVWRQLFPTVPVPVNPPAPAPAPTPAPLPDVPPSTPPTLQPLPDSAYPPGAVELPLIRHLPERKKRTKRLGRHVEHDPRSRAYAHPSIDRSQLVSVRHHRRSAVFDQGNLGSCTGNAMAGALSTAPFRHRFGEHTAVRIYEAATALDGIPGQYPPDDTGSSGLAVAKVAKQNGWISSYLHAFSVDAVLTALQTGPAIIGVSWRTGFDTPAADGRMANSGDVRGGHEIVIDEIDVENQRVWITNSWGAGWGVNGRAYWTWADLEQILADNGDVTVPVL